MSTLVLSVIALIIVIGESSLSKMCRENYRYRIEKAPHVEAHLKRDCEDDVVVIRVLCRLVVGLLLAAIVVIQLFRVL